MSLDPKMGAAFSKRDERGRLDLPLLSVTSDQGIILRDDVGRRDTSAKDKSRYLTVRKGDVVYNTMRMWQGVSGRSDVDGITSPAYTVCNPDAGKIDSVFASYILKHPALVREFRSKSQGIVDDTLSLKFPTFSKIDIALPPLAEQRRIAEILSSVDEAIQTTQAVIEQTRTLRVTLIASLSSGGMNNRAVAPSEIGNLPSGWEVGSLETLGAELHYGTSAKCDAEPSDQPVLRIPNVIGGKIDTGDLKFGHLPEREADLYRLKRGDLLVVRTNGNPANIGRMAHVGEAYAGALFASYLIRIRLTGSRVIPEWVYLIWQTKRIADYLLRSAATSAGNFNVNSKALKAALIPIPPLAEQEEICCRVAALQDSEDSGRTCLGRLTTAKHALMSDLLTGRKRVTTDLSLAAE